MLISRVISATVFFALFFLGLFNDRFIWALPLLLAVTTLIGTCEFHHFSANRSRMFLTVGMIGALALMFDAYRYQLEHGLLIIGLMTVTTLGLATFRVNPRITDAAGRCLIGMIYVSLPLALITLIYHAPVQQGRRDAQHYLIFLILVTWASDIGAYFVGRKLGRHKLAPRLSPGKTVEGFLGGVALSLLTAVLMKLVWDNIDRIFHWWEILTLGLAFGLIGPLGDLAESSLKRQAGVKDSGRTFTGHGGMLDVIDSLLFTTIFYYGYLWIFHRDVIDRLQ